MIMVGRRCFHFRWRWSRWRSYVHRATLQTSFRLDDKNLQRIYNGLTALESDMFNIATLISNRSI